MTAFTVNSGGTVEWDSLTGGSVNATLDTYTISNGSTLRIAADSYQCANHSLAFGSLDSVSFSGIGGRLLIDATQVRIISFNTGTGTVPAIGTSIVQGGVSGPLLGVWTNWQSEPLAAGAAMPAAGYIKIKSKTGGNFAAGALTNISASATGPDVVGWIEVRGADTAQVAVSRVGKFETTGDWFELGVTNGVRGQTFECPTTATIAGVFPGIWVETAAGSGVFERYCGVGSMVNLATNPTDERGKIFWQTTAGIRLGSDGTNNVGYLPPTGCKVRIPNIILTCCTRTVSGSGLRVLPNVTLATRQEFNTTSAGDLDISKVVCNWYANFLQSFRLKIRDSAFNDTVVIAETASPLDSINAIIAPTQAQLNYGLNVQSNFAGGVLEDILSARFSLAASGSYVNFAAYNKGISFNNVKSLSLTNRANATSGTWASTQNQSCSWNNCKNIGGRLLRVADANCSSVNMSYADLFAGTTLTTLPHYVEDISAASNNITISGINFFGFTNVQPYSGLVNTANSYNIKLRNIGTPFSPLSLGSTNGSAVILNAAGNNDGIRIQRVHVSNTRTGTWAFLNSDNNVQIDNVSGDYADTSVIAALNCTARGVKLTGATTGQTSVYGTHWKDSFPAALVGKIEIFCNEPTVTSASQCAITGGSPKFTSVGQVNLTVVGDEVTWEMPYFAKGHTGFAALAPVTTGTNPANLVYEFQYDKGAGYNGSWLTLNSTNLTGVGVINPSIGVKLKVRARCQTASASNSLTNIAVGTITTTTDQNNNPYPLDSFVLTLTGVQTGSDVVILQAGTSTERVNQDSIVGTSFQYSYETSESVDICVYRAGFVPYFIRNLTLGLSDASIPVSQVADRSYS